VDTMPIPDAPPQPRAAEETGLTLTFLADLALKTVYLRGSLPGQEIADTLKLPFATVVGAALGYLRREYLVEVKGSASVGKSSYRYAILQKGHARARELLKRCQ